MPKKKKSDREQGTVTLKDAFLKMLRTTKESEAGYFKARTKMVWREFFGVHVDENTKSLMVRNRKLYVYVSNAPLRAQLIAVREGIRDRLNAEFGEDYLEEVVIR